MVAIARQSALSWIACALAVVTSVFAVPPPPKHGNNLLPRIMGGSQADYNKYPFIVYLYNQADKTFCGGSIISDVWILTAAHCIKSASSSDITVFVGQAEYALDMSKGSKVAEVNNHPQYDDSTMENDISLLRLESSISNGKVSTINIDTTSVGDGTKVTALGWGYTEPNGSQASKQLKKGDMTTLSKEKCGSIDSKFTGNDGPRICVAADTGTDTCPGDSGGPLIREVGGKTVLTGITSFGTAGSGQSITVNCGGQGMISIFTHANYFKSFIDSTTGGLRQIEGSPKSDQGASSGIDSISNTDSSAESPTDIDIGDMLGLNTNSPDDDTESSPSSSGTSLAPTILSALVVLLASL
ncbi:hypothetical protein IWW54_002524 [Coemansia sp. RSA 2705]|nr:hypothetical protein IWW54_002524 [Coemansia sp. RSA 2705]